MNVNMSSNKVSVFLITGDQDAVIDTVKKLSLNSASSVSINTVLKNKNDSKAKKISLTKEYDVSNPITLSNLYLTSKQSKIADAFFKTNSSIRFRDFVSHIAIYSGATPSNAAVSRYLYRSGYSRKLIQNSLTGKSKVLWKR